MSQAEAILNYEAEMVKFRAAAKAHRDAQALHLAGTISDADYLIARAAFIQADKDSDAAEALIF